MSSMQPSGYRFLHSTDVPMQYMEPSGSSMSHLSSMHYAHEEQDDEDDQDATNSHEERGRALDERCITNI